MSDAAKANGEPKNYLNETYGIKSWLLTLDHKRIGILPSRERFRQYDPLRIDDAQRRFGRGRNI